MDQDQYLLMIESQVKEAAENAGDALKKYREAQAKLDALIKLKADYHIWVVEK